MLSLAVTLLAAQAPLVDKEILSLDGRCEYSPAALEEFANDQLWLCRSVSIKHDSVDGSFQFDLPGRGYVAFVGRFEGDRMAVKWLELSSGAKHRAIGACKIDRANNRVSVVSCSAVSRGTRHAVNFVPNRKQS